MKFGKLLHSAAEEQQDASFLRYKQLKKQLKKVPAASTHSGASAGAGSASGGADQELTQIALPAAADDALQAQLYYAQQALAPVAGAQLHLSVEQMQFLQTLNEDLASFNDFFLDKEEEAMIKVHEIVERVNRAGTATPAQLQQLRNCLLHLHGEMVLLLHWSMLNHAALIKILKKHDKRTGGLLKPALEGGLLHQPFTSTGVMQDLVRQAEQLMLSPLGPAAGAAGQPQHPGALPSSSHDSAEGDPAAAGPSNRVAAPLVAAGLGGCPRCSAEEPGHGSGGDGYLPSTSQAPAPTHSAAAGVQYRRTWSAKELWAYLGRTAATPSTHLPPPADMDPGICATNTRLGSHLPYPGALQQVPHPANVVPMQPPVAQLATSQPSPSASFHSAVESLQSEAASGNSKAAHRAEEVTSPTQQPD